jgi:hypothetical protein
VKRALAVALLAASLGGCITTNQGSVTGGECKVFEAPKYAVRGARPYDQDWIDSTIEGGVGGCKWERPAPRPVELDAAPVPKARPAASKVKRGWIWRARAKAWPVKALPAIVVQVPVAEPVPEAVPEPTPAPTPRSPIDELLHPGVK